MLFMVRWLMFGVYIKYLYAKNNDLYADYDCDGGDGLLLYFQFYFGYA